MFFRSPRAESRRQGHFKKNKKIKQKLDVSLEKLKEAKPTPPFARNFLTIIIQLNFGCYK